MKSSEPTGPRVLYVNWVDFLDAEARGGGVSVYQRNLMAADPGAVFLASGTSHDLRPGPPRWESMRHGPGTDRARRFEIVNSGVLAPAHFSFGNARQITHSPTTETFFDFIATHGPFDVVHFNNLEGLPAEVLGLKVRFPGTRVILSLHNYYPFCPQVNLWQGEATNCDNYRQGAACVTCLPRMPQAGLLRGAAGLSYALKTRGCEPGTLLYEGTVRVALGLGRRAVRAVRNMRGAGTVASGNRDAAAQGFVARRAAIVALINDQCDAVLCVSEAVRTLAVHYGVQDTLAHCCYIGTAQAAAWDATGPRPFPMAADGTLTAAYLGYMRRDKGFVFLLEALEALPDAVASRLRLVVAARKGEPALMARLEAVRPRLAALDWHDGYRHEDLDALLASVDLGLVPVLWHDNLPQVAIEMHARHIPLLCSDMGGAQELGRCADMVFAAGDHAGFGTRLAALMEGGVDMDAYWADAQAPRGMTDHMAELAGYYGGQTCA